MFGSRWSKKVRTEGRRLQVETLEDRRVMSASSMAGAPVAEVQPTTVQSTASILSLEEWVQTLTYQQFYQLTPESMPYLSTAQIATIPNSGSFSSISAEARAVMNQTQVRALNTANVRINLLTSPQVGYLTASQVQKVQATDFPLLKTTQIPWLTVAQIQSISSSSSFGAISDEARAALTQPQVQALNVGVVRIHRLTATQVSWLTVSQIQSLQSMDFRYLSSAQIPSLTPEQVSRIGSSSEFGALTDQARAALTIPQVQALNVNALGLSRLTRSQIASITSAQVQSLQTHQLVDLDTWQIKLVSTTQIAAIPSYQTLNTWSLAQVAALTVSQVRALQPAAVRLSLLTTTQISYLRASQIQAVASSELRYVLPAQVPYLTETQIRGVATTMDFGLWSDSARAALQQYQVQWLNVAAVRIHRLTSQQVDWLTPIQVRSLQAIDFSYLTPSQVPYLKGSQIVQISTVHLDAWSPAARAALSYEQIRALPGASLRIKDFTSEQVGWLRTAQIQSLQSIDFMYLQAWQIPRLSTAQFATITNPGTLRALPDELEAELTNAQLLALPGDVLANYTFVPGLATNYHPTMHMPIGVDGIAISPHMTDEANRFFALVPLQAATHTAIASGDWSNPAIWQGGVVPTAGAKVVIGAGTTVRFDAYMSTAIKTLRIDGTLQFAADQDTQLKVDTVVVMTTGKLHIGTEQSPIQNNVTARILIADNGPIDTVWDPYKLSRGVLSRGEVRIFGRTVTPYANAAIDPSVGDTQLVLQEAPVNWRVGDRLLISGTMPKGVNFGAEERVILAINGNVVTVAPLSRNHHTPAGYAETVQIANLTRNVEFVAEDSSVIAERPHLVFFHNPNVEVNYLGVYGFGRTDKSVPVNDPVVVNGVLQPGTGTNPRARYAMHFHHTGVNPAQRAAIVNGSVVVGSPGWGFVNHTSNVEFNDNVAYGVNGSAFVTEDGAEVGAFRRNLAISTTGSADGILDRSTIHDFGFSGHGFWLQGPGVELIGNISAGSSGSGFSYFTLSTKNGMDAVNMDSPSLAAGEEAIPVNMAPMATFAGNTAYAAASGLEIWHHLFKVNQGESYIDNFTSWNTRMSGIEMHYSGQITIRNAALIGDPTNPTGVGISTNRYVHDITIQNVHVAGFDVGVSAPARGKSVIDGGYFATVQGIYIEKGHDTVRSLDIRGDITFAPLTAAQLNGRTQYSIYMSSNVAYADQATSNAASFFTADNITYRPASGGAYRLYFYTQLRGMVPFTDAATGYVPSGYINRTNGQLESDFGLAFGGEVVQTTDTFERAGICGLLRNL